MTCEVPDTQWHAMLDDEVSPEERSWLQSHLSQCASCQRRYQELRSVLQCLDTLGETDRVEWTSPPTRSLSLLRGALFRRVSLGRGPLRAAAALLLVGLGLFVLWPFGDRRDPSGSLRSPIIPQETVSRGADSRPLIEFIPEDAESTLIRKIPSQSPDVHIVWVYPTVSLEEEN